MMQRYYFYLTYKHDESFFLYIYGKTYLLSKCLHNLSGRFLVSIGGGYQFVHVNG